jgi:hypothetical protein
MISGTDKGYFQRLKQFLVIKMCHKEGTGRVAIIEERLFVMILKMIP